MMEGSVEIQVDWILCSVWYWKIKSNPKWSSPWLKLSLSKEMVWFFCQLVSCPLPQGRQIHGQDGPGTDSRGVTNREVEIRGIWTRVALRCSVVWHWQWRRHQVGSGNGHGRTLDLLLVTYPASWIFNNNWTIWTTMRLSLLFNLHFRNVGSFVVGRWLINLKRVWSSVFLSGG